MPEPFPTLCTTLARDLRESAVVVLAAAACTGGPGEPDRLEAKQPVSPPDARERIEARSGLDRLPGERVPDPDAGAATGEVPEALISTILSDAASRSGTAPDRIKVTRAESLVWSDGSLGCGKPDELYTQAPVPGYRVVLDAGGQVLDYRATERGAFRLCENAPGPRFRCAYQLFSLDSSTSLRLRAWAQDAADGEPENLMSEANTEKRQFTDNLPHCPYRVVDPPGIAGPVRQEDAVWCQCQRLGGRRRGRYPCRAGRVRRRRCPAGRRRPVVEHGLPVPSGRPRLGDGRRGNLGGGGDLHA